MRSHELGGGQRGFLESARLRLIILGALRGFVKPGYDYSVASVVREELLLRAMSREIEGDSLMSRGLLESSALPVVEGMRRPMTYRSAVGFMLQGHAMRRLMPLQSLHNFMNPDQHEEINKTSALLKVLKQTDFCDRMAATLNAA